MDGRPPPPPAKQTECESEQVDEEEIDAGRRILVTNRIAAVRGSRQPPERQSNGSQGSH